MKVRHPLAELQQALSDAADSMHRVLAATLDAEVGPARPLADITADVLTTVCPVCAAPPALPCRIAGNHLARFAEAARSGLIPMADMEAALAASEPVFTRLTVIPGGAR